MLLFTGSRFNYLEVIKTIDLPIQEVWDIAVDISNVHFYHHYVESTTLFIEI